ncbi:MAG: hypothetical protein P1P74_04400 [Desulfuromonadales bacterium]|nr:hypothetical protein [Desulfuromonadales bacterium]MDT8423551.1 hypothetical protein [Desulfuromonadales bacterium]
MLRIAFYLICCLLLTPLFAFADPTLLEKVAHTYAIGQKGLDNYQATVTTDQVGIMITRMTTNMPADAPRPQVPELRKFWSRASGRTVILPTAKTVFPTMSEMIRYFSREFAIDPGTLVLSARGASKRAALLQKAEIKTFETRIGSDRTISITALFRDAVDVGNAFYTEGLPLPRTNISELVFDIDPDRNILRRMEIVATGTSRLIFQLRHLEIAGNLLPTEVHLTTADGGIDTRLTTEFVNVGGFLVPGKQVRNVRTPDRNEHMEVTFSNYIINKPLPELAIQALNGQ